MSNARSQRLIGLSEVAVWVLVAALVLGSVAAAEAASERVLGTGTATDRPVIQVVSQRSDGLDLEFTLPSLVVSDVEAAGETFQSVAIPGGDAAGEDGEPMVPTFSRFLAIPSRAAVTISTRIEEEEELSGYRLFPIQPDSGAFAYERAAYGRNAYDAVPTTRAGGPAVLRDLRVVPLTFAPVRYNPAEGKIKVARRVHVSVSFAGEDLRNCGPGKERPIASSFAQLYEELVVNDSTPERDVRPGAWLVICQNDPEVIQRLQPLLTWRQRKGLTTVLATTTETGSTNTQIKAYLQNAYDNWSTPLEHVVLAGDAFGPYSIPTWFETMSGYNGEGDAPYSRLAGDDPLAEVHIGRLSFNDLPELETIVAKIVGYESSPFVSDSFWFRRACLVGDPNGSGISCVQIMQWIKTRLRQMGYSSIDTVFSGDYVTQIEAGLNQGTTFFAYRGYLGMSGWSNSNCGSLTNGWRMPFTVISTCGTGSFATETSISEAFLRVGIPTAPKGAIAATGTATWGTHTRFNNCYIYGVYAGMLYEQLYTVGAAHTRGKYELYLNYWNSSQANYVWIFSHWNNLMGDPATECWTNYPTAMTVDRPAEVSVGANSVAVDVSESGNPVAGAQVCLWKGSETYTVGLTDAQGHLELAVSLPTSGDLLLTVTKHDRRPVLATIPVIIPPQSVTYFSSSLVDDNSGQSQGNGDGQANSGETIALGVALKNFGTEEAPGVTAVLASTDPYVSVLGSAAEFGTIPGGATSSGSTPYLFSVNPSCPHGHNLRFSLDASSGASVWHSLLDIPVVSVGLAYNLLHVDQSGNGILDPGESVPLSVQLANSGGLAAVDPTATLISLSPFVDLSVATASYPSIPVGGTGENSSSLFVIHAQSSAYRGAMASLLMTLQCSGSVRDTVYFQIPVGTRSSLDPCGPDAYGYYAFDNTDATYPERPLYLWIEADPNYGGTGTEVVLGDFGDEQDKSRTLDIPFTFRYYGADYTTATVCSNGWMVMGQSYLTEYRNWTIPAGGGPDGIIAAYWDDLIEPSGGRVVQKYDATGHKWIVEWSRMHNWVGGYVETFEIILYDPAYYPTETGDGMIDFQYHTVNNPDGTDGYATVGIEKPDHSDGLLYTYFNSYAPGAAVLSANRCIRFLPKMINLTSIDPSSEGRSGGLPPFGLASDLPNPIRPGQSLRFSLLRPGQTELVLYDAQGRLVRRLASGIMAAGDHSVIWDGNDEAARPAPSGWYFCRLASGERREAKKILLAR